MYNQDIMENKATAFDIKLLKRLMVYTQPYRWIFWLVALSAIASAGFGVLQPILLEQVIDEAIIPKNYDNLVFLVGMMIGFLLLETLFQFIFIYFSNWLGFNVIKDIRIRLFNKILHFKMQYFDKTSIGRLTTRSVNDMETIASIFSEGLFTIASDLLKMAVVLSFMFYKSWELSLIVLLVFPILLYATRLFQKAMKKAFEEVRNQVANLNSFVQEHLSGMKIVQLFTREEKEFEKFHQINQKHQTAWIKTVWYNSIFFAFVEMLSSITIGLIMWYGGLQVLAGSTISLGIIVSFIQFTRMLFRPLNQIADKFNTLQMGMVSAHRVFSILDTNATIEDTGTQSLKEVRGHIRFEEVHFEYNPGEPIIKGISFEVLPGQTIAIVGSTGAGKSTIINLLSRFYDIKSGTISIDGTAIQDLPLPFLRKQIAVVLQDVFLFADTIHNNITLNNPHITREQVIAAAQEIGVHSFIESLPGGYDYNVKERGTMLSTGQRQLIAFLRAYVSNPAILVLDEATSSVDSHSEQLIQNSMSKLTKNRTSIIIAHRLATVKKADMILVMENGKIIERGTHYDLLQIENGVYKNLYEVQFSIDEVA
jgi:ATP-binding cassette subfamily B multidrug efflux pump